MTAEEDRSLARGPLGPAPVCSRHTRDAAGPEGRTGRGSRGSHPQKKQTTHIQQHFNRAGQDFTQKEREKRSPEHARTPNHQEQEASQQQNEQKRGRKGTCKPVPQTKRRLTCSGNKAPAQPQKQDTTPTDNGVKDDLGRRKRPHARACSTVSSGAARCGEAFRQPGSRKKVLKEQRNVAAGWGTENIRERKQSTPRGRSLP